MKIPPHIKAVIFDMDGLMIDSEPYWTKADVEFAQRYGKKYTPEINKRIMGMSHHAIMKILKKEYGLLGNNEDLIKERRDILYEKLFSNLSLLEGAEALIHNLFKANSPLAIATGGFQQDKIEELLNKLHLISYFSVLVSGYDVIHGKPAPDIYLKTADLLHIDPSNCLVFEDAPNGVIAGKAAGMTVYGINKDDEIYHKLKEAGADEVFRSLKEVTI